MSKTQTTFGSQGCSIFQQIAQTSLVGILIYREKIIYANEYIERLSGYDLKELQQMAVWDLVDEKHKGDIQKSVLKRLRGECLQIAYDDLEIITKSKKKIYIKIAAETIEEKESYAGLGIVVDVTQTKENRKKIRQLAQALEQSDDMLLVTDINGVISDVNDATLKISGYSREELIGQKTSLFKSNKHSDTFYENLWKTILSGRVYKNRIINRRKNRKLFYVDLTITPIRDEINGEIESFVATGRDVTKDVLREKRLRKLALRDSLTELYNRYAIHKELQSSLARLQRYHQGFGLLIIDVDFFKAVNDRYGHYTGDIVLKKLAKLFVKKIRNVDRVGRWGGEEFLIIVQNVTEEKLFLIAEKLRKSVVESDLHESYGITISIGATLAKESDSEDEIFKRVDDALYSAKESGRNRVVLY